MRMIAGLETPTAGSIRLMGREITGLPPYKRNVGLVFQSFAIFPHMNVSQNVAFGLRMQRLADEVISAKVTAALDLVQLPVGKFGRRRPNELSGGQLQRVALARTLVTEPALVLFDEPMAALDRRLRDHMAVELRAIQKQLGIAAIYVTHDQESASMMSDRIVIMNAGRILQDGTPEEIYLQPTNRFVSEFLGDANVLAIEQVLEIVDAKARVRLRGGVDLWASFSSNVEPGMFVVIRPEHAVVHVADPGNAIEGTVDSAQFRNGLHRWHVTVPGGDVLMAQTTSGPCGPAIGARVWVAADPSKSRVVDP
ncbi:Putrescine transport ATP-binding protein PotA (plasmid) [Sinorhizobium fredii CCBAU 83666]|nr:Putrescine transport ATP-binding protein PotA [Sinorhizobium fredii CCBAU 83666]